MQSLDLLLSYPPSNGNFLFNSEIFERLRGERELAKDLVANGTCRRAKRKQAVNTGLAPIRVFSSAPTVDTFFADSLTSYDNRHLLTAEA